MGSCIFVCVSRHPTEVNIKTYRLLDLGERRALPTPSPAPSPAASSEELEDLELVLVRSTDSAGQPVDTQQGPYELRVPSATPRS